MKILFTGGGTAGHIFPIVAVIRELKKKYPKEKLKLYYVGPDDNFASAILTQEGVEVKKILAGKIRRYFSLDNIIDIVFKFPIGIIQAFIEVFAISPDVIFSKGGYGSLPVVIAGWILVAPIFLHESDVSPGLANRIAAKMAMRIFTSFPSNNNIHFAPKKTVLTGNPIRTLPSNSNVLNLTGEKPVILILGGSQGAKAINDNILLILAKLLEEFEVIHQTGERAFNQIKKESQVMISEEAKRYYHPVAFLNDEELSCAYNSSNLIISRAGSGSIFEIAYAGKPSILVPLAGSAQDHQAKNAYAYAETGAAIVMEEPNFTSNFLLGKIKQMFSSLQKLDWMGKRAKEFSKPEAAKVIAEYIATFLKK